MPTKRVLVLGAAGMLGKRVVSIAPNEFPELEIVPLTHADLDICNPEAVRSTVKSLKPYAIINCAAYTAVDTAETNPDAADQLNHQGPKILAQAAKEADALLVHVSTDYVFDGQATEPYTPQSPTNPISVYGSTKLLGEKAIASSGCRYLIVRTQWLYDTTGRNFYTTMLRLFADRPEVRVVNDQTGCPTHAAHLARALLTMVRDYATICGLEGIYHFAGPKVCTWFNFALSIAKQSGTQCCVLPITTAEYPTPAKRPQYSVLDCSQTYAAFPNTREVFYSEV